MDSDTVFAVVAEGTRRRILETLRDGDRAVGELVTDLGVSQPTVSKHLKVLREAGLVTMRAQGQKRYYSLDAAPLDQVRAWLDRFVPDAGTGAEAGDAGGTGSVAPAPAPGAVGTGPGGQDTDLPGTTTPPGEAGSTPGAGGTTAGPDPDDEVPVGIDADVAAVAERTSTVLAAAVLAAPGTASAGEGMRPIGRTMGRAAERAADLLSQLRRRRDPSA